MNNRISLPMLAKSLAANSGCTRKVCDDFLRELFSICSETLAAGEDIKVRGLGTFRIVDVDKRKSVNVATGTEFMIPGHKKVSFIPASTLAEAVNYSFGMFAPVEVDDAVSSSELEDVGTPDEPVFDEDDEDLVDSSEEESSESLDEDEEIATASSAGSYEISYDNYKDSESDEDTKSGDSPYQSYELPEPKVHEQPVNKRSAVVMKPVVDLTPDIDKRPETDMKSEVEKKPEVVKKNDSRGKKNCRFCWGVLTGFVGAFVLLGISYLTYYFVIPHPEPRKFKLYLKRKGSNDSIWALNEKASDLPGYSPAVDGEPNASSEVDTKPSDIDLYGAKAEEAPVTDVISTTRFLTTMAREHYGNDAFWPYIYEENKAFLGHPDRIRPGTKVVVPPLSKYGVDPKNSADIRQAKKLGVEIYNRYSK